MSRPNDEAAGGAPGDLGFSHRVGKSGAVEIHHHGRLAATLRGADGVKAFTGDADHSRHELQWQ